MKSHHIGRLTIIAAFTIGLAAGLGPTAMAANTINVGLSTGLTGSVASLGISNMHGIELAINKINTNGGLLGKQIKLLTADDTLHPSVGTTNVRHFVLSDHVKAIFGPSTSGVAAAEAQTATQYHTLIIFDVAGDVDLTGKYFSKYVFSIAQSSYMEPHAEAAYVAKLAKTHGWTKYATIGPNYSFGHSTVKQFLAGLHEYGVKVHVVSQEWPQLGDNDFTPYISATLSKNPNFVFLAVYGGDLVTFTKQAKGYGFFSKVGAYGGYLLGVLNALGPDAPAGVVTMSRTRPFYLHPTQAMKQFTQAYEHKFGEWPSAWAVVGYSAVETWAQAVKDTGSFDTDKVAAALSGGTFKTLRGSFKIRACDHLAEVPEYVGVLSGKFNQKYKIRTMTHTEAVPPGKIMMTCEAKKRLQNQN